MWAKYSKPSQISSATVCLRSLLNSYYCCLFAVEGDTKKHIYSFFCVTNTIHCRTKAAATNASATCQQITSRKKSYISVFCAAVCRSSFCSVFLLLFSEYVQDLVNG